MRIHFKSVQWMNFLSTGNAFTTVPLDTHATTLIVGENGAGKSTILDAICFALFGKPYRNINKPQLVNSINEKHCCVELEFQIGKSEYLIRRGIKPNFFEIYENQVLLNQDASSKDYQRYLEEHILKLNYKSFTQIVILGTASFTPFMQLPAAARREIIEDLLDIKIFSQMNVTLKEKVGVLKGRMQELDGALEVSKKKIQLQQSFITSLEQDRDQKLTSLQVQIDQNLHEVALRKNAIEEMRLRLLDLQAQAASIQDQADAVTDWHVEVKNLERMIEQTEKSKLFYQDTTTCPKCKQVLSETFKSSSMKDLQKELKTLAAKLKAAKAEYASAVTRQQEHHALTDRIRKLERDQWEVGNEVLMYEKMNQRLHEELVLTSAKDIEQEKQTLEVLKQEGIQHFRERSELNETGVYYDVAAMLLKDSGIKTKVIRKYIPIINKLVNGYLAAMDFFIQFTFNEKFEETIKSRHRDDFSYESFSEGEKQRIDLALLFTWRTVAKMKNSMNTNLLMLDEVFDSSLDATGTEYVMGLLKTIEEGTNTFVISHKGDHFFDRFNHSVRFTKRHNFSIMTER